MRRTGQLALDHAPHLRELLHQVHLRVQAAGGVDDHDVAPARLRRLDRVVRDRGRVAAALGADEVGARALRPDLELFLGSGAERVGRCDDDGVAMLRELRRELADRCRLPGAVDADDQDDGRRPVHVQDRRLAEERRDFLDERCVQVTELATRLEPAHELGGRGDADVAHDQRFLEPLPVRRVPRVERCGRNLADEGAPRLRERVAEPREHAGLLLLQLGSRIGLAEKLSPAPRHRA